MAALALTFDPWIATRVAAWALALAVGLWVYAKRPDAAGRAFAFWVVVWAGGVQLLLSLQAMAADAATAQLLYRAAYYATLLTTAAFVPLLLLVPRPAHRAAPLLGAVLGAGLLVVAAFALDHGAFLQDGAVAGVYAADNVGVAEFGYHPLIWTGFLAGMVWLGWQFPAWPVRLRGSAVWLMAGLALFTADRFARTGAQVLVAPAGLAGGTELAIYVAYQMAFGLGLAWMLWRVRGVAEAKPLRTAAAVGLLLGGTSLLTWNFTGLGTSLPVLVSALLGPAYVALVGKGVLAAAGEGVAYARAERAAVLSET